MNISKSPIALTLATILSTTSTQAAIIDMDYTGLFTWLNENGATFTNDSYPYYGDPTWGYGKRTQISGSLQFDTSTGLGSGTINPFNFLSSGQAIVSNLEFKSAGNGLWITNMLFNWNGNSYNTQVVLDASGFLAEFNSGVSVLEVFDASTCAVSNACATPASDNSKNVLPIGPAPIATSSFNTQGQTGFGTTLAQLSLGTDDGIGGSPLDTGPFQASNYNFDITSITVTAVPVPAAIWLFGTGLIPLFITARRKRLIQSI